MSGAPTLILASLMASDVPKPQSLQGLLSTLFGVLVLTHLAVDFKNSEILPAPTAIKFPLMATE